jgi:hypothetical protein
MLCAESFELVVQQRKLLVRQVLQIDHPAATKVHGLPTIAAVDLAKWRNDSFKAGSVCCFRTEQTECRRSDEFVLVANACARLVS